MSETDFIYESVLVVTSFAFGVWCGLGLGSFILNDNFGGWILGGP